MAELIVTDDIPADAARIFIEIAPRSIVLAGGESPRAAYQEFAGLRYPWSETQVFFGDERCVPPTDAASNYRMAWEALLSKVPAVVHPMPGDTCDAAAYESVLRATFGSGLPGFDLLFLGLGEDGHTASLFPGDPALGEHTRLVVPVKRPDHPRLTMTLPALSAAKVAIFLVSGTKKRAPLSQLLAGGDIPAARVRAERVLILADEEAGAGLVA